ncbi:MAG TPA: TetR family transcriptional regulator [Solirubrobacteraceae bacterium]|nr:TetR family transcriptional regulator [Solirubrobacteraceae bacterium]
MAASTATFQRARSAEHKTQRREAILAAAAELARRRGVREISLADIASEVGIHKSALLRYFETREQIFLELSSRAWEEWAASVETRLATARADEAAAVLARSFADRPLLCDLIAHIALNLERHVSVEAVRRYKLTSLAAVRRTAAAVAAVVPGLSEPGARELVSVMARLAGSTWQIANPPAPLAELYRSDPELAHACVDLERDLTRTAALLIAGLLAG